MDEQRFKMIEKRDSSSIDVPAGASRIEEIDPFAPERQFQYPTWPVDPRRTPGHKFARILVIAVSVYIVCGGISLIISTIMEGSSK